jgi:hypothetical protein
MSISKAACCIQPPEQPHITGDVAVDDSAAYDLLSRHAVAILRVQLALLPLTTPGAIHSTVISSGPNTEPLR